MNMEFKVMFDMYYLWKMERCLGMLKCEASWKSKNREIFCEDSEKYSSWFHYQDQIITRQCAFWKYMTTARMKASKKYFIGFRFVLIKLATTIQSLSWRLWRSDDKTRKFLINSTTHSANYSAEGCGTVLYLKAIQ